MMKIGLIGLGNMGGAIARILLEENKGQYDVFLANRSPEKAKQLAHECGGIISSNQEVFKQADVLFLGVKPSQMAGLLQENAAILEQRSSLLLISMAAGLSLESLQKMTTKKHRWIRIMPNTPVATGAGVITFSLSENATQADQDLLENLLKRAGLLLSLEEEELDAATAVAGCGPAFVFQFIEAMADAGVQAGLKREVALQLASQTVLGAAKFSQTSGLHPALLKDQVCSPAGATIAGVACLEKGAFRGQVVDAVLAAYQRTKELGEKK